MTPPPDESHDEQPTLPGSWQEPMTLFEPPDAEHSGHDAESANPPPGPSFIVRLNPTEYAVELSLLKQWVDHLLIPTYLSERTPSSAAPWCPAWWEHEEAVARLHGLWLAWQYWTDPEAGGFTGPDTWHRDCLDPAIRELRAPHGPLHRCMISPDKPAHRPARAVTWDLPTTSSPEIAAAAAPLP
ncbi:DUF4913 domain-containing protein [Nonomuraea fuscirosea]